MVTCDFRGDDGRYHLLSARDVRLSVGVSRSFLRDAFGLGARWVERTLPHLWNTGTDSPGPHEGDPGEGSSDMPVTNS